MRGPGAERLTLVGPDGVMAEGDATSELRFETTVEGPTWIAAVARGASHPNTLDESVLAHTSPVYVDVAGRRVARAADARWCLEFLDSLERFVDEHGHFDPTTRDDHFGDLVAVLDRGSFLLSSSSRDGEQVGGTSGTRVQAERDNGSSMTGNLTLMGTRLEKR